MVLQIFAMFWCEGISTREVPLHKCHGTALDLLEGYILMFALMLIIRNGRFFHPLPTSTPSLSSRDSGVAWLSQSEPHVSKGHLFTKSLIAVTEIVTLTAEKAHRSLL
jgi:hypothetical protein